MCGRYTNETEFSQIRLLFQASDATFRPWTPKYNISPSAGPGFEQLIVTADRSRTRAEPEDASRQVRLARFWLIPSFWSKPLSLLPTAFNARSEDLSRRKFWRESYLHSRCLVPATGWREFVGTRAPKQPYHFRPRTTSEASPLAFAGLWSTWTSPDGELVDSFAILTTAPSQAAGQIHDRMPLVLAPELYDPWLLHDAGRDDVLSRARRYASELELEIFPSDRVANNVHYEGPAACQRVDLDTSQAAPRPARKRSDAGSSQLSLLDRLPPPGGRR